MRNLTVKVAVSTPKSVYREVETVRKKKGRTRSAVVQEALKSWLRQQEMAGLVRQYEAGYRARPETRREIQIAEAMSIETLSSQELLRSAGQ